MSISHWTAGSSLRHHPMARALAPCVMVVALLLAVLVSSAAADAPSAKLYVAPGNGYKASVHRDYRTGSPVVASPRNGDVLYPECWHDGGWANLNYKTNRWFYVAVPARYMSTFGWLTASGIKKSDQPRLPMCVKQTVTYGDGSSDAVWGPPISAGTPGSAPAPAVPPPAEPGAPAPSITASTGGGYGCSGCMALNVQVHDFPTGTYTYACHDDSGPGGSDIVFYSHAVAVTDPNQGSWPGVFCYDSSPYTAYVVIAGVASNSVSFGSAPALAPAPAPAPAPTYGETVGGVSHTWTNYTNAGGAEGPSIPGFATVQIACKLQGFRVADGNTWWYRIAQFPWNGAYYVSADAFYNNGQTSGSLHGTPFVDPSVGDC